MFDVLTEQEQSICLAIQDEFRLFANLQHKLENEVQQMTLRPIVWPQSIGYGTQPRHGGAVLCCLLQAGSRCDFAGRPESAMAAVVGKNTDRKMGVCEE